MPKESRMECKMGKGLIKYIYFRFKYLILGVFVCAALRGLRGG